MKKESGVQEPKAAGSSAASNGKKEKKNPPTTSSGVVDRFKAKGTAPDGQKQKGEKTSLAKSNIVILSHYKDTNGQKERKNSTKASNAADLSSPNSSNRKGGDIGISGGNEKRRKQSVKQEGTSNIITSTKKVTTNSDGPRKGKESYALEIGKGKPEKVDCLEKDGNRGGSSEKESVKVPDGGEGNKIEQTNNQENKAKEAFINKEISGSSGAVEKTTAKVSSGPTDGENATSRKSAQNDNEQEEEDGGIEAFELIGKQTRKKKKKKMKKSEKAKPLRISIPSHTPEDSTAMEQLVRDKKHDASYASFVNNNDALVESLPPFNDVDEEEDPLTFYSNAHDGQDQKYVEFHSSRLKNRLDNELAKLKKSKEDDLKKVQAYIAARWDERNDALQRQINRVRVDMVAKQTRQRTQLSEKHKRQIEADARKIEEGEKWLIQKQQLELQQRMNQHQQMNLPNNGMVEWNTIAAQLQNRHAYQRQQFEDKKIEMKKRSEQELKAQNQILEAHHKKRQVEADGYIKDLGIQQKKLQETLRSKLTRLHKERFEEELQKIHAGCSLTLDEEVPIPQALDEGKVKDAHRGQGVKNAPELHASHKTAKGGVHEGSVSHDAVVRQKRRKGLMNNATIQLAIEIHNEGIIAMTRSNPQEGEKRSSESEDTKFSSDKGSGRSSTFIPWGTKARSFLYSIVLGEIPSGHFLDQIGRAGRGALGGGLVKCMITDTRTSEETAINERANMLVQVQYAKQKAHIEEIERRYNNARNVMTNLQMECTLLMEKEEKIAAAHKEAALQFDRANQTLSKFKAQAQHFFNQDGTPSPRVNPDSQQKLLTAMHKYKSAYESTKSKEATLRQPLDLARNALTHKKTELHKLGQDSMALDVSLKTVKSRDEKGSNEEYSLETNVENITATLSKIAEKRRSQVNKNKSNSGHSDSWEKSMSSMPEEKKKSFHQKMLRRRITTMLRPSHTTILADVKQTAKRLNTSSRESDDCFDICENDNDICPELRAEQLLLLALHPQSPDIPLPPVPDQTAPNQRWAEPGWQLILDNPDSKESHRPSSILHVDFQGQMTQSFLSSCCSSGRQAASLIKPRHLRMLTAPLSFTCQASAPAETNPSGQAKVSKGTVDFDPLSFTDKKLSLGYKFVLRPTLEVGKKNSATGLKNDAERSLKRRRSSKKTDVNLAGNPAGKAPTTKRRKSQTSKKLSSSNSPATDSGLNSQAASQKSSISPPFTNKPMLSQNQQLNVQQQQAGQYSLANQNNFPQQQQQKQQQQQQFQMQMRQLQAQLQLQQQQQRPPSQSQMQQMQFMPSQRPQDQQMPFPQQFNPQMNQLMQQNNMGNTPMQQHQQQRPGSMPPSVNKHINKK